MGLRINELVQAVDQRTRRLLRIKERRASLAETDMSDADLRTKLEAAVVALDAEIASEQAGLREDQDSVVAFRVER